MKIVVIFQAFPELAADWYSTWRWQALGVGKPAVCFQFTGSGWYPTPVIIPAQTQSPLETQGVHSVQYHQWQGLLQSPLVADSDPHRSGSDNTVLTFHCLYGTSAGLGNMKEYEDSWTVPSLAVVWSKLCSSLRWKSVDGCGNLSKLGLQVLGHRVVPALSWFDGIWMHCTAGCSSICLHPFCFTETFFFFCHNFFNENFHQSDLWNCCPIYVLFQSKVNLATPYSAILDILILKA